jgi:hypothetical protein
VSECLSESLTEWWRSAVVGYGGRLLWLLLLLLLLAQPTLAQVVVVVPCGVHRTVRVLPPRRSWDPLAVAAAPRRAWAPRARSMRCSHAVVYCSRLQ